MLWQPNFSLCSSLGINLRVRCNLSKLRSHGKVVECWSEGAALHCVGYWVPHCSGCPIEVLLQTQCYQHYVGVFAHILLCKTRYTFPLEPLLAHLMWGDESCWSSGWLSSKIEWNGGKNGNWTTKSNLWPNIILQKSDKKRVWLGFWNVIQSRLRLGYKDYFQDILTKPQNDLNVNNFAQIVH